MDYVNFPICAHCGKPIRGTTWTSTSNGPHHHACWDALTRPTRESGTGSGSA